MRHWVNNVASVDVDMWKVGDRLVVTTSSYATRQLDEFPAKLAGREAFASTIDVANVEQFRMNPDAKLRRVKLVMVRSGLVYKVGSKGEFPVLIVAGVADLPEFFDKSVVEFDKFLTQISIGGNTGYQQAAPPERQTPIAAPTAPPEPNAAPPAPVTGSN